MKKYITILIIVLGTVFLYSEANGSYGWQLLKANPSAAISAQGGTGEFSEDIDAFMFVTNSTSSLHFNTKVVSASYRKFLFDTNFSMLAYTNSTGKKAFGIAVRYQDYGKIDRRDETGDLIGEFHPFDFVSTLNFAYRLSPVHNLGANFSLLYEQLDTNSSYGVSMDLGYLYLSNIRGLRFATAIKNLGITSKMDMERIKLPITFSASIIQDFNILNIPISTQLKILKYIDDSQIKFNYGINATYRKIFVVRFGYKLNYETQSFTAGIGLMIKNIKVDYSYLPYSNDLNDVHQIGISYIF